MPLGWACRRRLGWSTSLTEAWIHKPPLALHRPSRTKSRPNRRLLPPRARVLVDAEVPFLVGGAFAHACFTGIRRATKDLDLFIRREDYDRWPR